MKPVVIHMNQLYKGPTREVPVSKEEKIFAHIAEDGSIVSFEFRNIGWNEHRARHFIRNRGINKIVWREHEDGTVVFNTIRMTSSMSNVVNVSNAENILGSEVYGKLMEIENEHGSEKPFLVEFLAMDFQGKDEKVANNLRFFKEKETSSIDGFGGISIHPGHIDFFQSWKDPVGNTVAPFVNSDGNPSVYGYIYPHEGGAVLRNNLRIAAAQGLLKNYPVSMAGRPVKYHVLTEEERDQPENFKVYANVIEWSKKSMDIVYDPAIEGSEAVAVVNKQGESETIEVNGYKFYPMGKVKKRRVQKVELTFSEIIEALKEQEFIALSDFMRVPKFKEAIDAYVKEEIVKRVAEMAKDDETVESFLKGIPEEKIANSKVIEGIVVKAVVDFNEGIDKAKNSVENIAKNAEIKLNDAQAWIVKNAINEPLEEEEILKLVQDAEKLTDFSDVPDFILGKDKVKETKNESTGGITETEVDSEEARKHIV
jgi:hypothetical protein